jgi:hypothetical protein
MVGELMKDAEHPFFRPLWRRIAVVAFCAAWAAFEFWHREAFWGTLAAGMAAYGAGIFLYNYNPPPDAADKAAPDRSAASPSPPQDKE